MILNSTQSALISEAINAGFTDEEALEYAGVDAYYAVQVAFNAAHRLDFPIEGWEPEETFTTLQEARSLMLKIDFPARIVGLNGEVIQ
jgi:hypothetical protein